VRGAADGSLLLHLRPLHTCGGEPGATCHGSVGLMVQHGWGVGVAQGGMWGAVDGSQVLDLRPLHSCGGEPGATCHGSVRLVLQHGCNNNPGVIIIPV
jgi:hypothetical protein